MQKTSYFKKRVALRYVQSDFCPKIRATSFFVIVEQGKAADGEEGLGKERDRKEQEKRNGTGPAIGTGPGSWQGETSSDLARRPIGAPTLSSRARQRADGPMAPRGWSRRCGAGGMSLIYHLSVDR